MSGPEPLDGGPHEVTRPPGVVACVIESVPRFHRELLRWYTVLTKVARVAPTDLSVGVIGDATAPIIEYLRSRGVAVASIPRFDERSPHSNKISGAIALGKRNGTVVLSDSDVAIVEDPRALRLPPRGVALKTVDAPYPPLDVLRTIFDAAGVRHPEAVPLYHVPTEASFVTNGNGGLYVIDGSVLPELAQSWAAWAQWLLERRELLGDWKVHVDQVSMALALASISVRPVPLDPRWNFPIHVPTWIGPVPSPPAVIHYHDHVDRSGFLRYVGVPLVDDVIGRVNRELLDLPRELLAGRGGPAFLRGSRQRLLLRLSRWAAASSQRRRLVAAPGSAWRAVKTARPVHLPLRERRSA
jgi:hypothetical protein